MDKKIIGMLKYIEQRVKYVELLVKEPTTVDGYTEKYKDLVVSIPLLTHDLTKRAWHHFEKLKDVPPQPKYHEAFGNSLFKLLMFFQDNGHWVVPSKEKSLYNWVKNQRTNMRQHLLRDVVGLPSSKFDREEHEEHDI